MLDLLQRLCELRHYKFLRLDGNTAVARRLELVDRFNNGYCNESKRLTELYTNNLPKPSCVPAELQSWWGGAQSNWG